MRHTSGMRIRTAAGVALVAALVAGAPAAAGTPRLQLSHFQPLTVRGAGFHAHERVRVTLAAPDPQTRVVATSASGSFSVAFPAAHVGHCTGYFIRAVGAAGEHALLRPPLPACMPA